MSKTWDKLEVFAKRVWRPGSPISPATKLAKSMRSAFSLWMRSATGPSTLNVNFWTRSRHLSRNYWGFSFPVFRNVCIFLEWNWSIWISVNFCRNAFLNFAMLSLALAALNILGKILSQNVLVFEGSHFKTASILPPPYAGCGIDTCEKFFKYDCWFWAWTHWHEGWGTGLCEQYLSLWTCAPLNTEPPLSPPLTLPTNMLLTRFNNSYPKIC